MNRKIIICTDILSLIWSDNFLFLYIISCNIHTYLTNIVISHTEIDDSRHEKEELNSATYSLQHYLPDVSFYH